MPLLLLRRRLLLLRVLEPSLGSLISISSLLSLRGERTGEEEKQRKEGKEGKGKGKSDASRRRLRFLSVALSLSPRLAQKNQKHRKKKKTLSLPPSLSSSLPARQHQLKLPRGQSMHLPDQLCLPRSLQVFQLLPPASDGASEPRRLLLQRPGERLRQRRRRRRGRRRRSLSPSFPDPSEPGHGRVLRAQARGLPRLLNARGHLPRRPLGQEVVVQGEVEGDEERAAAVSSSSVPGAVDSCAWAHRIQGFLGGRKLAHDFDFARRQLKASDGDALFPLFDFAQQFGVGVGQSGANSGDSLAEPLAQRGPVGDGRRRAPFAGVGGELEGTDICLRDDVPLEVGCFLGGKILRFFVFFRF